MWECDICFIILMTLSRIFGHSIQTQVSKLLFWPQQAFMCLSQIRMFLNVLEKWWHHQPMWLVITLSMVNGINGTVFFLLTDNKEQAFVFSDVSFCLYKAMYTIHFSLKTTRLKLQPKWQSFMVFFFIAGCQHQCHLSNWCWLKPTVLTFFNVWC